VDLGLYTDNCLFADPTFSFSGKRKYERNLRTLTAFFIDPRIHLFSLEDRDLALKVPGSPPPSPSPPASLSIFATATRKRLKDPILKAQTLIMAGLGSVSLSNPDASSGSPNIHNNKFTMF
jgi:hypothetical protein